MARVVFELNDGSWVVDAREIEKVLKYFPKEILVQKKIVFESLRNSGNISLIISQNGSHRIEQNDDEHRVTDAQELCW
jgi:hypothetical protein